MALETPVRDPRDDELNPANKSLPVSDEGLRHITGINPDEERAMEARAKGGGKDDSLPGIAQQEKGLFNSAGDGPTSGSLGEQEALSGTPKGLYNPNDYASVRSRAKGLLKIKDKRKAIIGTGAGGSALVIAFALFAVSTGPLEFVHIAQLLEKFHFSQQEDAQDNRLSKIARYIKDPSKPENTRLGLVGNKVADRLEKKMKTATGLEPTYEGLRGQHAGYKIDRDHPDFKGKSTTEIIDTLQSEYGLDRSSIEVHGNTGSLADVRINPDPGGKNLVKRYRANMKFARTLMKRAGYSKLSSHVGSRILGERAGWTFHPIKKLDQKILDAAGKKGKDAKDKLKKKFQKENAADELKGSAKPAAVAAAEEKENPDGSKTPTDPDAKNTADSINDIQNEANNSNLSPTDEASQKKFSDGIKAKVGGGAAFAVGMACLARNIGEDLVKEREAKAITPMMVKAGKAISLGSQVQSGKDISPEQLSFFKDFLDKKDDKGKTISTWNQAQSIQAELGETQSNNDIPVEGQVFNKGNPFSFLNDIPLLGTACGALNSTVGQIFSFATGPVATVVSGKVMEKLLPVLVNGLSGAPVSPLAAGADYGNYINYGARLAANQQYSAAGGVKLSQTQELALKDVGNGLDTEDFQSKNIAYRIFNPNDSRTLAAKVIDDSSSSASVQGMASAARSFGSIFAAALRAPANLISHKGIAAAQDYDYHGLRKIAFTADELGDPRFDNPFDNGCHVVGCPNKGIVGILEDTNKATTYTERAQKCFGLKITKDGDTWTIDAKERADLNGDDYPDACQDNGEEWLRIRFWILDTNTIESYDCVDGEADSSDQSCADIGYGTEASSSSDDSMSSTAGADIDTDKLYQDSTKIACADNTKDLGTQDGYTQGRKVKIRICAVSNLPSSGEESGGGYGVSGADGKAIVNSRVSGAVYAMVEAAKKDGVTLTANSAFRTMAHQQALCPCDGVHVAVPGTSNHQMGLAIDFGGGLPSSPGPIAGNQFWEWLSKNADKFGYKNYPAEAWHWSPTGH